MTAAERKRKEREAKKASGLKRLELWVTPAEEVELVSTLAGMRADKTKPEKNQ